MRTHAPWRDLNLQEMIEAGLGWEDILVILRKRDERLPKRNRPTWDAKSMRTFVLNGGRVRR